MDSFFQFSMCEPRGHNTASATEVQQGLRDSRQVIQQRIQEAQREVGLLEQQAGAINAAADRQIHLNEGRNREVEQQVRSWQRAEVGRARERYEKLQQELEELRRSDAWLEQLTHSSSASVSTHSSSFQPGYVESVTPAVSEVGRQLQSASVTPRGRLSRPEVSVQQPRPEPTTRDEFLQYSCKVTLDPNTAHTILELSERNTKARYSYSYPPAPPHADRFTDGYQVLSSEALTGRCYWEVDFRGEVSIAVSYKDIKRAGGGNECGFGYNDTSCALQCYEGQYKFWHNNVVTPVSGPHCSRVGVYLDHTAGIVSFYSVTDTMTLIFRGNTTFTQPLYAGLWLCDILSSAEVLSSANPHELKSLQRFPV